MDRAHGAHGHAVAAGDALVGIYFHSSTIAEKNYKAIVALDPFRLILCAVFVKLADL
jgi:hypothetical protein